MSNQVRIPLFPLNVVLFPGTLLPLHIFEPRYKLMIGECVETQREFGISYARPVGLAAVGCTASVLEIVRKYSDGRMDILTRGQSRYTASEVVDERPYYEADVEFLPDSQSIVAPEDERRLLEIYDRCHRIIYGRPADAQSRDGGESLAYLVAADLPLDPDAKQTLLEMTVEADRQALLLDVLYEFLPRIEQASVAHKNAAANGHGPN